MHTSALSAYGFGSNCSITSKAKLGNPVGNGGRSDGLYANAKAHGTKNTNIQTPVVVSTSNFVPADNSGVQYTLQ